MADLTTLASLKAYLGITDSAKDALLQSLITGASAAVEALIGRPLLSASYTEKVDGNGKARMMFPHFPVTAVASVKVNGVAVSAAPANNFTSPGYRFDETMLILQGSRFDAGFRNIELTYNAGYATIPADIQMAVNKIVGGKYRERDWLGYQSKSLAGETVSFADVAQSSGIKSILSSYMKVIPV